MNRECKHGVLKRSCDRCDSDEYIDELEKENEGLKTCLCNIKSLIKSDRGLDRYFAICEEIFKAYARIEKGQDDE